MIWCLHGFLGRGDDWSALRAAGAARGLPEFRTPDLFAPTPFGPRGGSLAAWGAWFAADVARQDREPVIVGYSLGGRLALHALLAPAAAWQAAVIVSAHPGLASDADRAERLADDERWARRFARDDWPALLSGWNGRPIFTGSALPSDRPEDAYDRPALAAALRYWSLGAQDALFERLAGVRRRVLWIAGQRDLNFVALGEAAVRALPRGELRVAPDAGHRVPWENAEWFCENVCEWLQH
ncbi:MAG TPA: alpha/beta fold hydrolase [Gemmatimonadales bacterium]|nr:alpha/beta fold hydrolase [Gemmatimonadales bacterium]